MMVFGCSRILLTGPASIFFLSDQFKSKQVFLTISLGHIRSSAAPTALFPFHKRRMFTSTGTTISLVPTICRSPQVRRQIPGTQLAAGYGVEKEGGTTIPMFCSSLDHRGITKS